MCLGRKEMPCRQREPAEKVNCTGDVGALWCSFFSAASIKYLAKHNLKGYFKLQAIIVGKPRQQEPVATGHVTFTNRSREK